MMLGASEKIGFFAELDRNSDWSRSHEEQEHDKMVNVQHKMTLLMFLMSKDDNLLVLTGGLIFALHNNKDLIDPAIRAHTPELFES
jgi:hypothetical protein